jgi:alpha-ketoglutaric semialdehyde dehydrogenase
MAFQHDQLLKYPKNKPLNKNKTMSFIDHIKSSVAFDNELKISVNNAHAAFKQLSNISSVHKILFFNKLIEELENKKSTIIETANKETSLPVARLENEFNRTVTQIKLFIEVLSNNHWKDVSIDIKKDVNNILLTDLRKINIPIGPVAVFGASNFPLAFSVAGGDTISALAAGCPVVYKAHNGHIQTSVLVSDCILSAGKKSKLSDGFFSILYDEGYSIGIALVKHPLIKAVGFTGSIHGGKALIDAVNSRSEPIPVFAEMGSLNPVILLPTELKEHHAKWAKTFAGSITAGCGQFCTKPGLFFALESESLEQFIDGLKNEMSALQVHPMLNSQIKSGFIDKIGNQIIKTNGVEYIVTAKESTSENSIHTSLAIVSAQIFIENKQLKNEFFGPFAMIVKCKTLIELEKAISSLNGQLTTTIIGANDELTNFNDLIETLKHKTGRILFNGVPTGVEVCYTINHGGPFPASSAIHTTSVGADAIKRFVRPLCYQSWPQNQLPEELKDENKTKSLRRINGKLTTDSI